MRIFIPLTFLLLNYLGLFSQCIHEKISTNFDFERTSGSPIGARIGIDEVVHTGAGYGEINVGGNQFFQLFINGILQINGSGEYNNGDIVRIKPNATGITNIGVISDEPGCLVNTGSNRQACLAPLPVNYFYQPLLKINNNKTYVTWSVASQINNDKYIIEHSTDGRNFSPIGEIAGDGTSNETKNYEYIHTLPSIGTNYYRIKQVDYDGKYSYSDMASVRYDGDNNIKIYPNPTTSEVTVNVPAATTLRITDVYGKLYYNQVISDGQNSINLSDIPTGILILVVGDQRFKVLKE
jgi:hypothetical protein